MTRRLIGLVLLLLCAGAHAQVSVSAVRVWPASEYTRVTLESAQALR